MGKENQNPKYKFQTKNITIANLVTGFRLVLFSVFVYLIHEGLVGTATIVFALAWGLDAIDGWVARRWGGASNWGYVFDKAVDRLILFVGLLVLLIYAVVPVYALFILIKDIVAMPAIVRWQQQGKRVRDMGRMGKLMAVAQGVAVLWLLLVWPREETVVAVVALVGGVIGVRYLWKSVNEGI